ncbi:Stc1 domain-containing protein, partial [Apiosordaria backusii]
MAVTKIRCSQGGEWKTKDQYSQSALRKFQKKVGMGIATPAESSIACVEHSRGTKAPEMQCQGPCDKWRELHFFSKSTRRNGINV